MLVDTGEDNGHFGPKLVAQAQRVFKRPGTVDNDDRKGSGAILSPEIIAQNLLMLWATISAKVQVFRIVGNGGVGLSVHG